jgi:hypothetical protein
LNNSKECRSQAEKKPLTYPKPTIGIFPEKAMQKNIART